MTYIHVEVYIVARLLSQEKETFSADDLRRRILREFGDKRPGVATHVSSRCVANTTLNHPVGYNYLWRIRDDEYRLFNPHRDRKNPERASAAHQPNRSDVPEKFRHLLE